MTFHVLTQPDPEDSSKGMAQILVDTMLTMNGIVDGSTVYWCGLIEKVAGSSVSYDCGLC